MSAEQRRFEFYKHLTTLNFAAMTFIAICHHYGIAPYSTQMNGALLTFGISLAFSFVMTALCITPLVDFSKPDGVKGWPAIAMTGSVVCFLLGMFYVAGVMITNKPPIVEQVPPAQQKTPIE